MGSSLSQGPLDLALTGETRLRLLYNGLFTGDVCPFQAGRRVQLWRIISRALWTLCRASTSLSRLADR